MIKRSITSFLLCCLAQSICAQQATPSVHGRVLGTDSLSIPGVAVVMQTMDSVFIDAVVSDLDGYFRVESPVRPYRLLFQHLIYKPFSLESSKDDAGIVFLEESVNELSGVTVTAERPMLKVIDGKLSYDLQAVMQNKIIDNTFDLLKELPSISASSDGNSLALIGALGETDILISGKKSNMSFEQILEYLRALPADRVERIEVVYNPPPAWQVKGSAVNVVLKEEDKYTLQGQVQGRYTHKEVNSYMAGGSLFLSSPRSSLDLIYNYNEARALYRNQTHTLHTVGEQVYDVNSTALNKGKSLYHNLYANLNHRFAGENSLNVAYVGSYTPSQKGYDSSTSNLFSDAFSSSDGDDYLHDVSVSYTAPIGLNMGIEYTAYRDDKLQTMQYVREEAPVNAFSYNTGQRINHLKANADMSHTLPKGWQLSYGTNYNYTDNTNTQVYEDEENNGEGSYNISSATKEHIVNVYAGLKKTFFDNKLNVDASLTGEFYKINEYRKNALLPNVLLTYTPVGKHIFQLGYRTVRGYPSYWARQDYTSYSDEYTVRIGNPDLQPARYSYASLMYILNSKYTFQALYYKINGYFMTQSYQSPDELKLIYKTMNSDYTEAFIFSATFPLKFGEVLSTTLFGSVFKERYKNLHWFDLSYDKSKWTGSVSVDNTLTLSQKPAISMNVNAFYKTPFLQGIWDLSEIWAVNAGLKWEIVKSVAVLNFQCNDIFESQYPMVKVRYGNQHQDIDYRYYLRNFLLSFSYNFKGYKEKRQKAVDTSRYGL